jgi:DnaJ-class molecular chaperone
MAQVEVGNVKTAQEMFRLLEGAVQRGEVHGVHSRQSMEAMIHSVLRQLDHMRPVGPDGKHGMLHTGNCGCFLEPDEPRMVTCPYCGGRGEHVQSAGDGTEYMQFCVRCHGTGQVNDQRVSDDERGR